MKIIYISDSIIPSVYANSVHVMKMCQALAVNNNEVTLICRYGSRENKMDDYDFYGVTKKFNIKKLWWPKIKGGGLIYGFLCKTFLKKFSRNTLVYGRCIYGILPAAKMGFECIFEAHTPPRNRSHFNMEKKLFETKNFKRLVVISEALASEYIKIFPSLKDKEIIVAHDGADPLPPKYNAFKTEEAANKTKVGYIGHLYKGKAMEIIEPLSLKCSWAEFHIIGGTKNDLSYWKNKLKQNKNIHFHGFIPHSQIIKHLLSFDVVLIPIQKKVFLNEGQTDIGKWTSPLKMFEYMSAGKAIIASDLPTIREVLVNNENSLLCNPENIEEWMEALIKLKNSPLRETLGQNAKKDLEEKYSWTKRAVKVTTEI